MTVTDNRPEGSAVDETEVLFHEARARRRRRRLVGGISVAVVLVLALVVGIALVATGSAGKPPQPVALPGATAGVAESATAFSLRPVLCDAPPLSVANGAAPLTGSLPACSPSHALSAADIGVHPYSGTIEGYTSDLSSIQPDPQFAAYASTPSASDTSSSTVLLPGNADGGNRRYVLGPAGITASDVQSARAHLENGQWVVDLTMTSAGARHWDALAQQQFHALVGEVVDGQVVSDPITQPTQLTFASFEGRVQISGSVTPFTASEAKKLAAQL